MKTNSKINIKRAKRKFNLVYCSMTLYHSSCICIPRLGVFFLHQGRWLQTPGIPQGSLMRRSWTLQACLKRRVGRVQMNGPNRFIHNSDSSPNAPSGSKQTERSAKGGVLGERGTASGRRRDGRRERGRYQESRFSQISLHLRDKGNNGFRCGKLQRDMYHLPLHCERRITGSTEQREWDAVHARMWGDILKCAPDNLL